MNIIIQIILLGLVKFVNSNTLDFGNSIVHNRAIVKIDLSNLGKIITSIALSNYVSDSPRPMLVVLSDDFLYEDIENKVNKIGDIDGIKAQIFDIKKIRNLFIWNDGQNNNTKYFEKTLLEDLYSYSNGSWFMITPHNHPCIIWYFRKICRIVNKKSLVIVADSDQVWPIKNQNKMNYGKINFIKHCQYYIRSNNTFLNREAPIYSILNDMISLNEVWSFIVASDTHWKLNALNPTLDYNDFK